MNINMKGKQMKNLKTPAKILLSAVCFISIWGIIKYFSDYFAGFDTKISSESIYIQIESEQILKNILDRPIVLRFIKFRERKEMLHSDSAFGTYEYQIVDSFEEILIYWEMIDGSNPVIREIKKDNNIVYQN